MSLTPDDVERRIRAKRLNERLKLLASSLNTVGLAVFGAAVLVPLVGERLPLSAAVWFLATLSLHLLAHVVLGRLTSED
ncbi:hypothetical protein ACFSCV_12265 [Methylopila henanensis]|uniref:Uncharacterized protein n=1 Tax=Methylopila henanensis TaxID=873516 RepID=A0ABW4K9N9_9HYPH